MWKYNIELLTLKFYIPFMNDLNFPQGKHSLLLLLTAHSNSYTWIGKSTKSYFFSQKIQAAQLTMPPYVFIFPFQYTVSVVLFWSDKIPDSSSESTETW